MRGLPWKATMFIKGIILQISTRFSAVFDIPFLYFTFSKASFGAPHTGQAQLSGSFSKGFPSAFSSYSYPQTVHLHIMYLLLIYR